MGILATFTKQPSEVQDYDIDFAPYLTSQNDLAESFTYTTDPGITVVGSTLVNSKVKLFLSGGLDGTTYKVTVLLTTVTGRKKEADIRIRVREY